MKFNSNMIYFDDKPKIFKWTNTRAIVGIKPLPEECSFSQAEIDQIVKEMNERIMAEMVITSVNLGRDLYGPYACIIKPPESSKSCSFCSITKLENYYTGKTGRIACPECFKERVGDKLAKGEG